MPDELTQPQSIHGALTAIDILLRLGVAGFLGVVVAGSYLISARHREGAAGLTTTLILLAMLISLVTLAIGSNLARPVHRKGDIQILQSNVMDQLIVCPLQKTGVDRNHRLAPLTGNSGGKGHRSRHSVQNLRPTWRRSRTCR